VQPVGGQASGVGNPLGVKVHERLELPKDAGQYWVEYDLKPYTMALKGVDRPQQAVIDWIIRETGSDLWFQEPVGVLTADRSTLRVYHNAGMQKVVAQVYERFVNGINEPQDWESELAIEGFAVDAFGGGTIPWRIGLVDAQGEWSDCHGAVASAAGCARVAVGGFAVGAGSDAGH
jgi:hypothetical protein